MPRRPINYKSTFLKSFSVLTLAFFVSAFSQPRPDLPPTRAEIKSDEKGHLLLVEGQPMMVKGMTWGYSPVGESYAYDLWSKPDAFIKKVIDYEFSLMQEMGVNVYRIGPNIPPEWVQYIFTTYGIYAYINEYIGRYGMSVDGQFRFPTDYSDPRTREIVKENWVNLVNKYKDVPGVLMYGIGNENNYGLEWSSTEIEDLPTEERHRAKAEFLYSLKGEVIDIVKSMDPNHPVGIVNGEVLYIDLVAKYCSDSDYFGANVYRGISSGDLFERVEQELAIPFLYTEFGADAYNAKLDREDDVAQALYHRGLWKEVYENSYGKGKVGNAIGGLVFQWADEWWKFGQSVRLEEHDTTASWANGGYPHDFVPGKNNMNEEWFGITALGPLDENGVTTKIPRTSYYVLQSIFGYNIYHQSVDEQSIDNFFETVKVENMGTIYAVSKLQEDVRDLRGLSIASIEANFESVVSGRLQGVVDDGRDGLAYDHMQSVKVGFGINPNENLEGNITLSAIGNVAQNKIDDFFYEQNFVETVNARVVDDEGTESTETLNLKDRLNIYSADFSFKDKYYDLTGFYRVGHYHWGNEGDFFSFYPESFDLTSADTWNTGTPYGIEFAGKSAAILDSIKVVMGPSIYPGANPQVLVKYFDTIGSFQVSLLHREDIAPYVDLSDPSFVPSPITRRTALWGMRAFGAVSLQAGLLFSSPEKIGEAYTRVVEAEGDDGYLGSGYYIIDDYIRWTDTLGGRIKVNVQPGPFNVYAQATYNGLVAEGGGDSTTKLTGDRGWALGDNGAPGKIEALLGTTVNYGSFQFGPHFLYRKPLVEPNPNIGTIISESADNIGLFEGVSPRNQNDDPFTVIASRETIGGEFLFTYDPTPATYFYNWDHDQREEAYYAANLHFVANYFPNQSDSHVYITEEGYNVSFGEGLPSMFAWSVNTKHIFNPTKSIKLIGNVFVAQRQPSGTQQTLVDDDETFYKPLSYGMDGKLIFNKFMIQGALAFNEFGPYDFHEQFDLRYPLAVDFDISQGFGSLNFGFDAQSRFGARFKMRTIDEYAPGFEADGDNSAEMELTTYIQAIY